MRVIATVISVAALSVTIAVTSSDAFGPITIASAGGESVSVGVGVNASDELVTMSKGGGVLCCWTCSETGKKRCGMKRADVCARIGEEVSSCSECQ